LTRLTVILCLAGVLFVSFSAVGQRGRIIKPATTSVMDPNQDGFISTTTSGFSNDGYNVDEFEIPMFGLPISEDGEVLNDIQAGSNCGTTELTVDSKGFAVYGVLTTTNYLFFRFRVAKDRPSVEAYSILIDTDRKTGNDDPNSTANNPGFEIDITLIKNQSKGVYVYSIDGIESCPVELLHYDLDTNFQISIADEVSCSDPDYFYDFYVPFAHIASAFNITTATELRFVALTNVSATCAMGGKISDIGGVDDGDYAGCNPCAFISLAENQCPTALTNLCPTCQGFPVGVTPRPTINAPLKAGEFEITGTSLAGAEVYLGIFYNDGSLKERDTIISDVDGKWVSIVNNAFALGDSITAQARAVGQCNSGGISSGTSFTIVVENEEPVLSGPSATLIYTENDPATSITPSIAITDADDEEIDGATIVISGNYLVGEDVLLCSPPVGISANFDAVTGTLTLSGISSLANYQIALRNVKYSNTSESPATAQRTVQYMVNDGMDDSNIFSATIDVIAVNDAPVLTSPTNTSTFSGAIVVINNALSITDADHAQLTGATISISNNFVSSEDVLAFANQNGITGSYNSLTGVLTLTGSASLANYATAISSVEYNNTDGTPSLLTRRVSFVVTDGTNNSNTFNTFVDFPGTNNPPNIVDENGNPISTLTYDIDEDTLLEECINVSDADGDLVIIDSFTNQLGAGVFSITGELCFKYAPPSNFNGSVTATLTACDQTVGTLCDAATVTINVLPVNDAPVVTTATVTTGEDLPLQICVAFTDVEGDASMFTAGVLTELSGTITDTNLTDLCFTYSPKAGFVGKDTVSVTICDAIDNTVCSIGEIYLVVTPAPNHKPEILINGVPGDTLRIQVEEDSVAIICFEAIDPEGDDVTLGTVTKNSTGGGDIIVYNNIEFCFLYSPVANFNGQISWTVNVCDNGTPSACGSLVILLDVVPVNDPPVIVTNTITTAEDSVLSVCLQITDIENDPVGFVQGVSRTGLGSISDANPNDECFTFTTPHNSDGTDTLDVTVCDLNAATVCTTKSIVVTILQRPNDPPQVVVNTLPTDTIRMTIDEDAVTLFCLDVIDPNDDDVAITEIVHNSGGGTLALTNDFCFRYIPEQNYFGNSSWRINFCDNEDPSLCGYVVMLFTINSINDAPLARTDTLIAFRNEERTLNLLLNDSDVDGDQIAVTPQAAGTASQGQYTIEADGMFRYRSDRYFKGTEEIEYEVCDDAVPSLCSQGVVKIIIEDLPLKPYEAFSPNNDGNNDYWRIEGVDFYPRNLVQVFDRFNNLVFQLRNYNNEDRTWTGSSNHGLFTGQLPEGTYFYAIILDSGEKPVKGFVVLKRE
jgi:gliding motility-associated-like protein